MTVPISEPPPHEGLRPLSPHGEGYCTRCRFIVGLDDQGRLERHERGRSSAADGARGSWCPGEYGKPGKAPYSSRKSALRVNAKVAVCPECARSTELLPGSGCLDVHTPAPWLTTRCPGSMRPPG